MTRHVSSLVAFLFLLTTLSAEVQTAAARKPAPRSAHPRPVPEICRPCIRAHMDFLASDALRGRGSATPDELVAATYIASELMQYDIQPAGDEGGFLQHVPLIKRKFSAPAQLRFTEQGDDVVWKHGLEILVMHAGADQLSGPFQVIDLSASSPPAVQKGAFVFLTKSGEGNPSHQETQKALDAGAAAVLIPPSGYFRTHWQDLAERFFFHTTELADDSGTKPADKSTVIMLSDDAAKRLRNLPDGTSISFSAPEDKPEKASTWNVIGTIRGRSERLQHSAVLLSAHLDHLGVGKPVNGDAIYNGADDDASGVTAVLELARVLGKGPRPERPVIFALYGSEELGDLGSTYFLDHSPVPLSDIATDLEFEMIGRADPSVKENQLWLTGWKRSNLGPTLAAHGAHLVVDPHPEQNFFARSDNFALAKRGVVAQTISSYGLHPDYHQPSDEISGIDFEHMDQSIASLLRPLEWLVNSSFQPKWKAGEEP